MVNRSNAPSGDRPLVEHDRRPGVTPGDPARGYRTTAPADVLADREVHVVPGDPLDPPLVPELREPGVDVDERCPPKPAADRVRAHVAADVDEQVAPCGRVGVGVLEPEAFGGGARVVEVRWSRVVRLLDQAHPTAEPAEAERVAQPHPGLAAVCRPCSRARRRPRPRSRPELLEQTRQDEPGVEALLGKQAGRSRVRRVVGEDPLRSGHRLVQRREREQPLAERIVSGQAGVLDERRLAAREVAGCSVAEPARMRASRRSPSRP